MADVSVDQSKLPGVKEGRPGRAGLAGPQERGCAVRGAGHARGHPAWPASGCGKFLGPGCGLVLSNGRLMW